MNRFRFANVMNNAMTINTFNSDNSSISNIKIQHPRFPKHYQDISKWSSNLSVPSKTSSTIASQITWHNKHILVDKTSFYNTTLADKRINHVITLVSLILMVQ